MEQELNSTIDFGFEVRYASVESGAEYLLALFSSQFDSC